MIRALLFLVAAIWAATIKMPKRLVTGSGLLLEGEKEERFWKGIGYLVKKLYWIKYGEFGEESLEWLKEKMNGMLWKLVEILEKMGKPDEIRELLEEDELFLKPEERLAALMVLRGVKEELVGDKVDLRKVVMEIVKDITENGLSMETVGYDKGEVKEYLREVRRQIRNIVGMKWGIWYIPEWVRERLLEVVVDLVKMKETMMYLKVKVRELGELGWMVNEKLDKIGMEILELVYKYLEGKINENKLLFELKGIAIRNKRTINVEELICELEEIVKSYWNVKKEEVTKKEREKMEDTVVVKLRMISRLRGKVERMLPGLEKLIEKRFGTSTGYRNMEEKIGVSYKETKEKIEEEVKDEMEGLNEEEMMKLMEETVKKNEEFETKIKKALRGANLEERTLIETWWGMVSNKEIEWDEARKGFGKWGLVMVRIVRMLRRKYDVRVMLVPEEEMVEGVKGMIREYIRYEDRKRKVRK
jgi:hypothetical protein